MSKENIEISVKGKWVSVPGVDVNGLKILVKGKWLKVAYINQERFLSSDVADPEACAARLNGKAGLRADIFTFAQRLTQPVPQFDYPLDWDSHAAIRTSSFKDWWDALPQTVRKNVRRSQKRGVVITVKTLDDDLVRGIVGVNNDSPMLQGKPNMHFGKSFDEVKRDHTSFAERTEFICAHVGDELIGFIKLIYAGEIVLVLSMTTKPTRHEDKSANALIAKAVELCEQKGVSYLRYGYFNYGNKGDSSLRQFKVSNGFSEILVPRFYVPLTALGRLGIKTNVHRILHRGPLAVLPESVITWIGTARSKWYDLTVRGRKPAGNSPQGNRPESLNHKPV